MPTRGTGQVAGLLGAVGAIGVLVAAAAILLAWEGVMPFAVAVLAGEYVGALYARGRGVDRWSLLEAVGLLALAELGAWSAQARVRVAQERAVVVARALWFGAIVVVSVGAGAVVLSTATFPRARGIEWAAMGTAAAVAVLAVIALLSRPRN